MYDIVLIAGSRTGGQISSQPLELDSPGVHSTVHSWDSHANYHGHYGYGDHHGSSPNALAWPRASHLVLYCDVLGHLKTAIGVFRLLLLVSNVTLCDIVQRTPATTLNETVSTDIVRSVFGDVVQLGHCQGQLVYVAFSRPAAFHDLRSCLLFLGDRIAPLP